MSNPFASHSHNYAGYRPVYPFELVEFLSTLTNEKQKVWDCGTGNGQLALKLTDYFSEVFATDISPEQLQNATQHPSIHYSNQPAEHTNFPDQFFDLIAVAQAVHWFDFDKFYDEVNRTLKSNGIIAVIGYGLLNISSEVDGVIRKLYEITGPFWDWQRKYLDEEYRTIPFPFEEIKSPEFSIKAEWSLDHLVGYLNTWSGVKHFIKAECYNPVNEIFPHLKDSWGDEELRTVNFPLFVRVGNKKV